MKKKQISGFKYNRMLFKSLGHNDHSFCTKLKKDGNIATNKVSQIYHCGFLYVMDIDLSEPISLNNPKFYRIDTIG